MGFTGHCQQLAARWASVRGGRTTDREGGSALVEYLLLLSLIAVVCIVGLTLLGNATGSKYSDVAVSIR
ncbi:MAG: Flp family type IVb pilin [Acidimicrobiales bacterium]